MSAPEGRFSDNAFRRQRARLPMFCATPTIPTPRSGGFALFLSPLGSRAMPDFKSIDVQQFGPVTVVKPSLDRIVHHDAIQAISDDLMELVATDGVNNLVLSLKRVSRYSSEAIGGLIRVEKQLRAKGGQMKLCMDDDLRELFRIASLDGTLFEIFDSESDAVAAFFEHGRDVL